MRNRLVAPLLAAVASVALLPAVFGQTAKVSKDATAGQDGISQDLMGVWQYDHYHNAIFPKDEKPPFTAWGEARFNAADTMKNDPNLGCLPHGIPRMMMAPLPIQIFQVPGTVLIEQESLNEIRQIHLNRQHLKDPDPSYNGDSIGKWEGNTLVIDTTGFNDITWLDHVGLPHSDKLHIVERIRRVDHDTLRDDFTIEDPIAYTKTWTTSQTYKLHPDYELMEYTCEGNHYQFHPQP